jgi:NADH-quinone oxidoreductase subunit J
MSMEWALFYGLGSLAVGASLLVVGQRNPMHSVLLLIGSFAALSGLYIQLDAPFVAMIQIIIYAGAIMVLFLFVVMLLNAGREEGPVVSGGARASGAILAVVLAAELMWAARAAGGSLEVDPAAAAEPVSDVAAIGRQLFTEYGFAFEVTSVLILVAMLGAVVLARRESEG